MRSGSLVSASLAAAVLVATACASRGGEADVDVRVKPGSFMATLRERDRALAAEDPERGRLGSTGEAAVRSFTGVPERVGVYEAFEIEADIAGEWVNPFDPADAKLDAVVTTPGGKVVVVPGFYGVGYERSLGPGGVEQLTPTGTHGWRVRFAPREPGVHRVQLRFDDGSGVVESQTVRFMAVASDNAGFVRRSPDTERYLQHDDGSLYFPLGLNHGWPREGGTYDYDDTLERTAAKGGNTVRVWLAPTFQKLSLETSETVRDDGHLGGLGWINQDAAWRFDHVVDRAQELGVKVLPVAFSFSGWRSRNGPSNWAESPYNEANGGPMASGSQVFTHPDARELAKRRLRYIVARWGASSAVMAWELWNEVTGVDDYDDKASAAWHREMAAYLKELDPHEHLVTTSTWWVEGTPRIDGIDDIDIVMTHEYNAVDHAVPHYGAGRWKPEAYGKPHMTGEFGNQEFDKADSGVYDPETTSVHNVMWAGLTSGSAGGGLYWYWLIGNKADWHALFRPIAEFVSDMPLQRGGYAPIEPVVEGYVRTPAAGAGGTVLLPTGGASWNRTEINTPNTFTIDANGVASTPWLIPSVFHPRAVPSRDNAATFRVTFARDGWVGVRVTEVSGANGSGLRITVDGEAVFERVFEGTGDLERYHGLHKAAVSAGEHEIVVEAIGEDWFRGSVVMEGVTDSRSVPLWVTGLANPEAAAGEVAGALWARHLSYSWGGVRTGATREPVEPATVRIGELTEGLYEVVWIDTHTGKELERSRVEAGEGGLVVRTPVVRDSAAAKIRRR